MRIALIGCGGVGKSFLKLMGEKNKDSIKKELTINYIVGSKGGIYDDKGINCLEAANFLELNNKIYEYPHGGKQEINFEFLMGKLDIDILVELTPTNKDTGEPAITYMRRVLKKGIHVVTGNKGPILLAYNELNTLASKNGVQLGIGCTTGGALPSINAGLIDMAGAEILSIEGILNGSTNFILREMAESKIGYLTALKKAQKLGIAETDPSLDVDGWDTASKLLILTNVLMGKDKKMEDITVEGITNLNVEDIETAMKNGEKYKLIGKTQVTDGKYMMTVKPERIKNDHPLYGVEGKDKAVKYTSDTLGDLTIIGGASGTLPAAASIYRDIINIVRGYKFSN